MIVLLIFVTILAAIAMGSAYLRKAHEYLRESEGVWDRLYNSAARVVADDQMPPQAAAFAIGSVYCSGCGCLTWSLLWEIVARRFRRRQFHPEAADQLIAMPKEKQALFAQVVINSLYYDALRAPVGGFLVRRFVYPWLRAASTGSMPTPLKQSVFDIAGPTGRVIEQKQRGFAVAV